MKNKIRSLARHLARHVPAGWNKGLAGLIRKEKPLNHAQLAAETEERMTSLILLGFCLFGIFISFLSLMLVPRDESGNPRVITRREDGETERIPLILRDGEEEKSFVLEVGPEELSDEEFSALAKRELETLPERILGENGSLNRVETDLTLPVRTKEGNLEISWMSDQPDIISRKGKVDRQSLEAETEVVLTACIAADDREEKTEIICVVPPRIKDAWEKAEDALRNMEREERTSPSFTLPEEIGEIRVDRKGKKAPDKIALGILLFFSVVVLPVLFRILAIRRAGEKRREEMKDGYFRFVNRLSLYLGAGLSVTETVKRLERTCREKSLQQELHFTLNRIRSGWSEPDALTELGRNIGLPEYKKLLALISQNLYHGSDQLLVLLAEEEQEAVSIKKERTRKKGEEASEKLLLPTGLLLLTVIGIVVYPALVHM